MAKVGNATGDLPARSYVSLTEFFTWALDGVARDDAAVKQLAVKRSELDSEIWGDAFGPGWLKHLLELIRDGHEVYPKYYCADPETYSISQGHFLRAQRWLERHGGSATDALVEVEQELARRIDRDPRHLALERLLYDRAAAGMLIVKARKWDDTRNCAASEYEPIPGNFFLRPCRFFYSVFHGHSELVRWPDDDSPDWLLDSVFNKDDPPVSYVEAKIAREDALMMEAEYRNDPLLREKVAIARHGLQARLDENRRSQRHAILRRVENFELTPDQGEEEAREAGVPPLNPTPDQQQFDPMSLHDWSIEMLLAWIVWRDSGKVRHYWQAWRNQCSEWRMQRVPENGKVIDRRCLMPLPRLTPSLVRHEAEHCSNPKLMGFDEALADLWRKLRRGELKALAVRAGQGERGVIDKDQFADLELAESNGTLMPAGATRAAKLTFYDPLFEVAAVLKNFRPSVRQTVAAEAACKQWLVEQMREADEGAGKSKIAWYKEAAEKFKGLGNSEQSEPSASFKRAWDSAILETGAKWDRPGRKKSGSRNPGPK